MYTTTYVRRLFSVSHQTVKNWAIEFAHYLSPRARPERNKQRFFNEDDLAVFALVASMGREGQRYEAIHVALATGQRGAAPEREPGLAASPLPPHTLVWREELETLRLELVAARAQTELLEKQLQEAQREIWRLHEEIGRYKATRVEHEEK